MHMAPGDALYASRFLLLLHDCDTPNLPTGKSILPAPTPE